MHHDPKLSTDSPLAALLHQNILEVFSGLLLVSIYCLIFGFYYSEPMVWYWSSGMFLLYAIRYLTSALCVTFKKDQDITIPVIPYSIMIVGMFLNGLGWSYLIINSLLTFGLTNSNTIMAIVFCSIRAISCVGNFYGNPKFIITFLVSVITPTLAFTVSKYPDESLLVIACTLSLAGCLLFVSYRIHNLVTKTSKERSERDHFYTLYANAKRENEQLNISVKTTNEKQHELEAELSSANTQLNIYQDKANKLAHDLNDVNPYDEETGLIRANNFKNILKREWQRMERLQLPISTLHVSIDDYESYCEATEQKNRKEHLLEIANVLKKAMKRPADICARINQDQFIILLPETDNRETQSYAKQINENIEQLQIPHEGNSIHSVVTVSVGAATMIPGKDIGAKNLSERAASALYEASFHGGNKIVAYRSLNNLRLEHWDPAVEGNLTEDALVHKLAVWGYSAEQIQYEPGTYLSDRRAHSELIHAVLQGKLKVTLEGESTVLLPGDCLFIPKGQVSSAEVVGKKPVVCLQAERSELILDTIH